MRKMVNVLFWKEIKIYYCLVTKPISREHQKVMMFLLNHIQFIRDHAVKNNVKQISMPKIESGLDRLKWYKVKLL